jgi:hypothetical protein
MSTLSTVIVSEGDGLLEWLRSQGIVGTVVDPVEARIDLGHVAGRRVVGLDPDVTFAMASAAAEVVIVDLGEYSVRYTTARDGREDLRWVTFGPASEVAAVASLATYHVTTARPS